jgi:hypothetical protein
VKSSARIVFAALLAFSLAAKIVANAAPPGPDPRVFDRAALAMLSGGGFAASSEARGFGTLLHGTRGDCILILTEYEPHGTFAQRYRELAASVGPLRYAWRGRVYAKPPRTAALAHFYLWRELRRVRIAAPRSPLAAWAASPSCDTRRLDWRLLASLPA